MFGVAEMTFCEFVISPVNGTITEMEPSKMAAGANMARAKDYFQTQRIPGIHQLLPKIPETYRRYCSPSDGVVGTASRLDTLS